MKNKADIVNKVIFSADLSTALNTKQGLAKKGFSVDQATRSKYRKQSNKKDFWEWLDWDAETEFKNGRLSL